MRPGEFAEGKGGENKPQHPGSLLSISPAENNNRCQANVGFKKTSGLGMVVDRCNPSMWAGEAGGLCSLTRADPVSNPKR